MKELFPNLGIEVDTLDVEQMDYGPSALAAEIAARVKAIVEPLHQAGYPKGLDLDLVDHCVSEGLAQYAAEIRRGREIDIEYIGRFARRQNGAIHYEPDAMLQEVLPERLERVA
jgi:hypothetical protein